MPHPHEMDAFCHLNVHSYYTLLSGSASPEKLAKRAAHLGFARMALTDTNALYGAVPFSRACRRLGVEPVIGAHIQKGRHGAVLLVRDEEGYKNICRLITRLHIEAGFSLEDDLPSLREGLAVLVHDPAVLARLAGRLDKGQLYAEVVPHGVSRALEASLRTGEETSPSGRRKTPDPPPSFSPRDVLAAAERLNVPAVITAAAYMSGPGELPLHRLLAAIREKENIADVPERHLAPAKAFVKTPAELAAGLPDTRFVREAFRNTETVAAECAFDLSPQPTRFPVFPLLKAGETPYSRLCRIVFARAAEMYRPLKPAVVRRLARELETIDSLGFSEYFLIVHDIAAFARTRGIPAVGRGSAAGSLTAYLLDITTADPLKYDLCFERFLNPQRKGCPDIDVDICWKGRDEVIDYVYGKYGAERVAMIAAFNTFRFRAAFRDAALAMGLGPSEVDRLSRLLPRRVDGDVEKTLAEYPEARCFPFHRKPHGDALKAAAVLEGFPRHLSIHPGGLVIGHEKLSDLVPLERAAKGIVITQYDMNPIEELGMIKIDLLGQRGLSAVAEAEKWVRKNHGVEIDRRALPEEDEKTAVLLSLGRTIGCFQIESPAMRGLLARMKARRCGDVIAAIALIRPGPASSGMKETFIRRRLGSEKTFFAHPLLEKVLAKTHGVMLYQEDVLAVAREIAGFSLAEADVLRKAMTKERSRGLISGLKERFLQGAAAKGISSGEAARIFSAMEGFASYSFCKAHAVTYGLIAFEAAFLKARFPAELLASVIANEGGFYPCGAYVEEARRLGVRILPPCVNRSALRCKPEREGGRGSIRPGLLRIAGLASRSAEKILKERKHGVFLSLDDFLRRIDLARKEEEALVLSGAFDFTDLCRPELLWRLKRSSAKVERHHSAAPAGGDPLLFEPPQCVRERPLPPIPPYSLKKKLELEYEHLGFTPSGHPMTLFASLAKRAGAVPCSKLPDLAGRAVTAAGWVVAARRVRTTSGRLMKFLTLEDASGIVEALLFPEAYERLGHAAAGRGPYLVKGVVESKLGFPALDVRWLRPLGGNVRETPWAREKGEGDVSVSEREGSP